MGFFWCRIQEAVQLVQMYNSRHNVSSTAQNGVDTLQVKNTCTYIYIYMSYCIIVISIIMHLKVTIVIYLLVVDYRSICLITISLILMGLSNCVLNDQSDTLISTTMLCF